MLKDLKRFLFRLGYLPIGDVQDILDRAVITIKPLEIRLRCAGFTFKFGGDTCSGE
jgi:hypothetical protein